jgi:hypothetical protein
MKKNTSGRISLLELIVILVLVVEGIYLLGKGLNWYSTRYNTGNDGLYVNTCESVAKVNSLNGTICPVNNCGNGTHSCVHYTSQGYIGYFDSVSNTIVGTKPKGYNSTSNPKVGTKEYTGEVGTMVLRVTVDNGNVVLDWVVGKK